MTERTPEELEAIQVVVDRVGGYQDGAPERTVEEELSAGIGEAEISVPDADVVQLAAAIESEHGTVDAESVLG